MRIPLPCFPFDIKAPGMPDALGRLFNKPTAAQRQQIRHERQAQAPYRPGTPPAVYGNYYGLGVYAQN